MREQLRRWTPTHRVTQGCYLWEFDAPCETRRLRAQKRRTPWPENEQLHSIPFPQDGSERPQSFCFHRASGSGRWGRRQQCSSRQRIGALGCAQRAGARVPLEIARGLSLKWRKNPRRDQARAHKLSKEHTPYKPDLTDVIQVSQPGRQCRLRVWWSTSSLVLWNFVAL